MAANKHKEDDIKYLERQLRTHKGKWLTGEVVKEFQILAAQLPDTNGQIIEGRRKLCNRLVEEYGVTELEAANIINGFKTMDYVIKYNRIRNQIPLIIKNDKKAAEQDEDEDEI